MNKRAFTLIELLIVMGILALIVGITIPTFSSFKNQFLLNAAAQKIASELRRIQILASTQHETLSLDPSKLDLPKGIKLKSAKTITFSSSGFPPPGGAGTIVLENQSGKTKKIAVSSMGRVRVE